MPESTITPRARHRAGKCVLGAGPGARLVWHVLPDGRLIVRAKTHSVLDLAGSMKSPKKKPVPIDDMNAWR